MTDVLRYSDRFVLTDSIPEDEVEHRRRLARNAFAAELVNRLRERGGIVGPIHETTKAEDDWLSDTPNKIVTHIIYAAVTDLPEPESYRLMGGPADGRIMQTGGLPIWRVPMLPPMAGNPFDVPDKPRVLYAEYERQGETNVYLFRRTSR